MSYYIDWQKKLSDDFDVDGYPLRRDMAREFHKKFCKAKADGMREAAKIMDSTPASQMDSVGDVLRRGMLNIHAAADKIEHGEPTE